MRLIIAALLLSIHCRSWLVLCACLLVIWWVETEIIVPIRAILKTDMAKHERKG